MRHVDTLVVGAGFGGLSVALTLAEQGADVLLVEALKYPGGCASTFTKQGFKFEAGATLFSGFGPGQLMREWIDRYGLDVQVQMSDPTVQLPAPDLVLPSLRRTERPVQDAMECHGAHQPRAALDAVCQITVQAPASQAQAPFAMGAMDDCFRLGTGAAL